MGPVLIGIGMGAEADITPYLLSRYFGLASLSTYTGLHGRRMPSPERWVRC